MTRCTIIQKSCMPIFFFSYSSFLESVISQLHNALSSTPSQETKNPRKKDDLFEFQNEKTFLDSLKEDTHCNRYENGLSL